jgi:putative sterol carrier protein
LKGIAKFIVRGTGGGTWTINLDACPPMIAAMDQEADCTITIKADDLLKLASGQLNVGECYLQARLRVAGNEGLAISLGRTLFA